MKLVVGLVLFLVGINVGSVSYTHLPERKQTI